MELYIFYFIVIVNFIVCEIQLQNSSIQNLVAEVLILMVSCKSHMANCKPVVNAQQLQF